MRANNLDDCDRRLLIAAAQRPLIKFRASFATSFNTERFHIKRVEGLIRRGALFCERDPDAGERVIITEQGRKLAREMTAREDRLNQLGDAECAF